MTETLTKKMLSTKKGDITIIIIMNNLVKKMYKVTIVLGI